MSKGIENPAFKSEEMHKPEEPREEVEEEPIEGPCSWGGFTPHYLQCCNNPKGFLVFYCLLAVVQGFLVNGLVNISISTIEKRYELSSTLTGVIASTYDIALAILCLFVSFYGARGHKPRWMAFSAFMMGLGAFVFSLPHYNCGLYRFGSKIKDTCPAPVSNSSEKGCTTSELSPLYNYLYVFLLGQLLMGIGGTAIYTLGTAYIDDSVPSEKSSLYIGIAYGTAVLGPAIGYIIGGQFLNIYIDVNKIQNVDLTPEDPRWLGAWWIPFLLSWPISWLLVIPFLGFPKHLPGTARVQREKVSQAHQDGSENIAVKKNLGKTFKDFPLALVLLLKNPVFMCLSITISMEGFLMTGLATFMPKYIENQYGTTSSSAATLGGSVLIPGAAVGQLLGGLVVSHFKLKCKSMIRVAVATSIASLLLTVLFISTECPNTAFGGISVGYNDSGKTGNLTASCNALCGCENSNYSPVCGENGVQFFSACFAGCKDEILQGSSKVYYNCTCIGFTNTSISENYAKAYGGKCETKCSSKPVFIGLSLLFAIFTFFGSTPITTATLRCVPPTQRPFALGIQSVLLRIFGTIPGPVILGATMDYSCTQWDVNSCGTKGACWIYDNSKIAYSFTFMCAVCKSMTIIFNSVALYLYKPPKEKVAFTQMEETALS
ncbi:SO4C1 protein, partial [Atractosteus spatula]|nr:SO4C1 protein [Atractosteus spatula]